VTATALTLEFSAIRDRTRRLIGVSVLVHAFLLLYLAMHQTFVPEVPGITEITLIEPAPQPAAAPVVSTKTVERRVPEPARIEPTPRKTQVHFPRELVRAEKAPRPQNDKATEDKIQERLASLTTRTTREPSQIASVVPPTPSSAPRLADKPVSAAPVRSQDLTRSTSGPVTPLELSRNGTKSRHPIAASAPEPEIQTSSQPARETDSVTKRTLAGATLAGPVADRPLISYRVPRYPDWAKKEGVEGSVELYFVVLPNGKVKENVMVQRTSGFQDFDWRATQAILAWRFEPLDDPAAGEQWGTITLHFRLSDTSGR
jgi:TonB family protein